MSRIQRDRKPIMPPSWPLAREGAPFLLIALGITVVSGLLGGAAAGLASLILPAYVILFFRDPERMPPEEEGLILSPADGKVISLSEIDEDRFLGKRLRRICIFMSLVNVHVNRAPLSGRVKKVKYRPGRFLVGFAEKASLDNEQNAVVMEGDKGEEILFVQIAGFIARRIVCYLKEGDSVDRGERFGLIRFGSRMDVYLPLSCKVLVQEGQKVKGGETPLARFS